MSNPENISYLEFLTIILKKKSGEEPGNLNYAT